MGVKEGDRERKSLFALKSNDEESSDRGKGGDQRKENLIEEEGKGGEKEDRKVHFNRILRQRKKNSCLREEPNKGREVEKANPNLTDVVHR